MLPARLTFRLLSPFLRGSVPTAARHGLPEPFLGRRCPAASSFRRSSRLGREIPHDSVDTEGFGESADMREHFLFPEYLLEPEPEPTPKEQLRELQQQQEEEEKQRQQRREERRQQNLRARLREHWVMRHPDPAVQPSGVNCSGCGAELHCQDPSMPGYLPHEKFLRAAEADDGLARTVCQRCWLLVHHRRALHLQVSRGQYLELVSAALRRPGPSLVLYMVDLLDLPDALLPHLPALVGSKQLIVLGNKLDLLPQDAAGYRQRLRERLWDDCARAGLLLAPGHRGPQPPIKDEPQDRENSNPSDWSRTVVRDVRLISAKTGYGVEELISALQSSWRYRGDVYLVGATNAGKSTLFNTLLESDYCTAKGTEAIDRATISPWPGTTLNLLKFPICNPTPYRMFKRQQRLKNNSTQAKDDLSEQEQNQINFLKKHGYVVGRVGRTFLYSEKQKDKAPLKDKVPFEFDADSLAFDMENEPVMGAPKSTKQVQLTAQDVKDAHWFYDTPGITKENCGNQSAWFTVVASNFLPVHITSLDKADALYEKHAGHMLLQVPMGGKERMAGFPPLVAEDITLKEGLGESEAVADIKFSSAGWVAVTPHIKDRLHLRAYTPEGTVLTIRPPLLPYIINVKGKRIKKSVAYKTKKPPSLVYNLQKKKGQRAV
ncbi:nitric oxide-associated protein 1 isoform X2 [Cebus imitator]|uniref:nitric oxide-associated protein 1 isoform X2 n=1 Tax=Cebus imitator TaxID=2715852 RepID=UPI000809DE3D|nr:nitric oxide-associated protein 1 isoform X2 [Cebus imitator]